MVIWVKIYNFKNRRNESITQIFQRSCLLADYGKDYVDELSNVIDNNATRWNSSHGSNSWESYGATKVTVDDFANAIPCELSNLKD